MARLDMTQEEKNKFFEEQEARVQKLREKDPMKQTDYSILEHKVEKKKPNYKGIYANFNRGMANWKKLGD